MLFFLNTKDEKKNLNTVDEKNNQFFFLIQWNRKSVMGCGLDKEISGSFSDYLSLMLGKSHIKQNNLKTILRFPCLGLNPIIDSINVASCHREFSLLLQSQS